MENGLIVGAGLLALLLGTVVFNNDDDDSGSPETASPDPDISNPDPDINSEDGTAAADVITDYDVSEDDDRTLSTYGGDDLIDLWENDDDEDPDNDGLIDANINAGDGEDTISLGSSDSADFQIDGGNGSDVIDVAFADSSTLIGGNGDDSITVHSHQGGDHDRATILGGAGDDLIHVDQIIATEFEAEYNKGPIISGGEGTDRFELSVAQDGNSWNFDVSTGEPLDIASRPYYDIATITDFASGLDQLAIDATTYSTSGEYLGHEILQSDDGESTGVMLQYTELNSIIWLEGTESITEDDLQISAAEGTPLPVTSNGNDLIDSELGFEQAVGENDELRTQGGDDTISLSGLQPLNSNYLAVDLGAGEDRIDGGTDYAGMLMDNGHISGGAGNDSISLRGSNFGLEGGDGADTLTLTDGNSSQDFAMINGGDGDDLIGITYADTSGDSPEDIANIRELTGGAGNDTFSLDAVGTYWKSEDPSVLPEDIDPSLSIFTTAEITDFTSGEDQLVINTDYSISDQYIGHVFVPRDDGSTVVVLRFVHPDIADAETRTYVRLSAGTTITDSDLIVNSTQPATQPAA